MRDLLADVAADLRDQALTVGILLGLLAALFTQLAGQEVAAAVDWLRDHLCVVATEHGPVVIEEGSR